jgi:mannitol-1-phosphate 5-dehydrogenase
MGHATCAYLGLLLGDERIDQAIGRGEVKFIVQNAMNESAKALSAAYDMPLPDLLANVDNLIFRFGNTALGGGCAWVGHDAARKLGPADRFLGAWTLCAQHAIHSDFIALGAACALYQYVKESGMDPSPAAAESALEMLAREDGPVAASSGAEDDVILRSAIRDILHKYTRVARGTRPDRLAEAALADAASAPVV